jgi:hypothetical protein
MDSYNSSQDEQPTRLTGGQWFILALLVLLNAAVMVLLVLALTGQLTL